MKEFKIKNIIAVLVCLVVFLPSLKAQAERTSLSDQEKSIIAISSLTAKGDLTNLKTALNTGLQSGLTVNEIKEILVHTYAYCGFPRSIRGLQTFMEVMADRESKGINDVVGKEASLINDGLEKYERGKLILSELTQTPPPEALSGYSAFAPVIERFLKEHLFADIFERDVLTYAQRELVTISVIATIGHAEPMLSSHMKIAIKEGITQSQLHEFVKIIEATAGKQEAIAAGNVLEDILKEKM